MRKIAVINDMSGYGRCSLTVALPLLSVMGNQACPVPTSILSNHTAYPDKYKLDLTESLAPYFQMWEKNGFSFDGVMSGYLGKAEQTETVLHFILRQKELHPETRILVDPVMADHGSLYCSITPEHIEGMKRLCRAADLISPNLTEACFLCDMEYTVFERSLMDVKRGEEEITAVLTPLVDGLRRLCRGTVVITGIEWGDQRMDTLVVDDQGRMQLVATTRAGNNRPGTGDMFISILAAEWLRHGDACQGAERACSFIADGIRHSDALGVPIKEGVQFEDLLEKLIK